MSLLLSTSDKVTSGFTLKPLASQHRADVKDLLLVKVWQDYGQRVRDQ